jgi:hypothetical protein
VIVLESQLQLVVDINKEIQAQIDKDKASKKATKSDFTN